MKVPFIFFEFTLSLEIITVNCIFHIFKKNPQICTYTCIQSMHHILSMCPWKYWSVCVFMNNFRYSIHELKMYVLLKMIINVLLKFPLWSFCLYKFLRLCRKKTPLDSQPTSPEAFALWIFFSLTDSKNTYWA